MKRIELGNEPKERIKKKDKTVKLAFTPLSPEELLDSLADIIIERIIEEGKLGKLSLKL